MTKLVVLLLLSFFSLSECVGWVSDWYCAIFPPTNADKATAGQSSSAKSSKPASVFMVGQPPASPVTTQVTQNTAGAEFCPTYAVPSTPSAFRAQSIDDGDIASENISVQSLNDEPSKLDDLTPLADHIRKIFEKYVANDKEMKQLINKKITQRTEKEALEEAAKFYGVAVAKLEKALEDRDAIIVNFKTMNGEQKRAIEEKAKKIGSLILDAEKLKAKHQELLGKLNETNQDRARLTQELKIHTQLVDQLREQNAEAQKEIEKLREDHAEELRARNTKHAKDLTAKDKQYAKQLEEKDEKYAEDMAAKDALIKSQEKVIANLRDELEKANRSWARDKCKWFTDYLNVIGSGLGAKVPPAMVGVSIYALAERARLTLEQMGKSTKNGFKAYITTPFMAMLESHTRLIEQYYRQHGSVPTALGIRPFGLVGV
ncbi:hypothetical protein Ddc_14482 [Ditylenchus destructor]|nr:hypothetical protein Ddc_14482 [Ditylenchus destructor]